jgi:hypothetical protein
MDIAQTVLISVIIILAILLLVVGVQVFFILREFRKTVDKANKVLDNTNSITESVSTPLSSLANLAGCVKSGSSVVSFIKKLIGKDKEKEEKEKNE